MKKILLTAIFAACATATLSAADITSFVYATGNCHWSTDGGYGCPIGVANAGDTLNPFIPVNNLPNGSYLLFFGNESLVPYFAAEGTFNTRFTFSFSDNSSTTIFAQGETASFYATSSSQIPHDGDQSITLTNVPNTSVDRVGSGLPLTPNGTPDIIILFSNVPATANTPEPATAGMMAGAFGLLAWMWRKRASIVR